MRVDRLLAMAAGLSRAQAREALRAGRVSLDGKTVTEPETQAEPGAAILLDGKSLDANTAAHIMLNKPVGVLTAARDPRQPTVMHLLPERFTRVGCMPVGRLDKDSEGLLLLTTDGELAHRLLSPKREISKEYLIRATGTVDAEDVAAFRAGVALTDFTAQPALLEIVSVEDEQSVCRVTLSEGKHRQVRRMMGARGHEVVSLKRLRVGPVALDASLNPGEYRELTQGEARALYAAVGLG